MKTKKRVVRKKEEIKTEKTTELFHSLPPLKQKNKKGSNLLLLGRGEAALLRALHDVAGHAADEKRERG